MNEAIYLSIRLLCCIQRLETVVHGFDGIYLLTNNELIT